jgi:hypothetical protein
VQFHENATGKQALSIFREVLSHSSSEKAQGKGMGETTLELKINKVQKE